MSKVGSTGWRMRAAIGCLVGVGALYPFGVMAQEQPAPSGAAVEVGGVTAAPSGAPAEVGGVTAPEVAGVSAPGGLPATGGGPVTSVQPSVAGAQGRPLVLPNTGGGPQENVDGLLAILAGLGLVATGGGAYLRLRASRRNVGG
jgi:hypothetical protein